MEGSTMFTVFSSVVYLLGIWYLIFWKYRTYSVDAFRQDMFTLRDELFDAAREGLIDFNHPAYGVLRSTINGFIRFGHRFTIGQFLFMMLLIKRSDLEKVSDFMEDWGQATEGLDKEKKARLEEFRARMDKIAVKQLILGTPEFFILYPFIILAIIAWLAWKVATSQTASVWAFILCKLFPEMNSAAYFYGRYDRLPVSVKPLSLFNRASLQ